MERFYDYHNFGSGSACVDALSGSALANIGGGAIGWLVGGATISTPAGLGFLAGYLAGQTLSNIHANSVCYEWLCNGQ
jgi:hypothetical protein